MLPLDEAQRVRLLSSVWRFGPAYHLRRIVVITLSLLVLLAVPILGLVRIDLWGGNHVLLGESVEFIPALKGIIVAIGSLWGTTFLTNTLVGRFFCGWGCPVGYVSRLGENVDLAKKKKEHLRWAFRHLAGAGFVATFIGSIMLWWVDPRVFVDGSWTARLVVAGVFSVLCIGGYLHAFVWRFGFCVNACPIGLYYRFVTSRTPIGIQFVEDPSPCIECGACEKICPVDIDPKRLGENISCGTDDDGDPILRYGDAECIRCGDCVEACRMIYRSRDGEVPPMRFGRLSDLIEDDATEPQSTTTNAP